MKTDKISESTSKGRHITTHRELTILENGGILIDNPGMREVGVTDTGGGLETTFDLIFSLAQNCRYKDCTHTAEAGCAVIEALESGGLDEGTFENYHKLQREKSHFETSVMEKRKKDKIFGKIVKDYYKLNVKGKK
jgi:ribosome biogenesis GTPase